MYTVEVHAASHIGRVRKGNEDNYLVLDVAGERTWTSKQDDGGPNVDSNNFPVSDDGVVVAVSDGMGGALAGEVASTMAVETVSQKLLSNDFETTIVPETQDHVLISRLYEATIFANQLIHDQGRSDMQYQGMGATFTGVSMTPGAVDIIQVGDSRAYLVRNARIYQVTKDQSLVQQLIDAQQISAEEAETHTLKNVILQALGAQSEIYPVSARIRPYRDDIYMLCSDGLSNKISANRIQQIISENSNDLKTACVELIREANQNGGEDNITVILARTTGDELSEAVGDEVKLEYLDLGGIHDTAEQDTAEMVDD